MTYRKVGQPDPKRLTSTEAAYLAGFVDGEGTLCIYTAGRGKDRSGHRSRYFNPILAITQYNLEVLLHVKSIVGCGRIHYYPPKNGKLRGWQINFNASILRWLLPQISPYLVLKKPQANLVMEFIEMVDSRSDKFHTKALTDEEYAARAEMYNQSRRLNLRPTQRHKGVEPEQISTDRSVSGLVAVK